VGGVGLRLADSQQAVMTGQSMPWLIRMACKCHSFYKIRFRGFAQGERRMCCFPAETNSRNQNFHIEMGIKQVAETSSGITSTVSVSYRRLPAGHAGRMDQALHVYASGFFADVLSPVKQVVALRHNGLLCARHRFHSVATSVQLHHFSIHSASSFRLKPALACRLRKS
jgi:hypothetical protein